MLAQSSAKLEQCHTQCKSWLRNNRPIDAQRYFGTITVCRVGCPNCASIEEWQENSADMWRLQTVNKAAKVDPRPIPKTRDLFAKVAGAKKFSILDLSQTYHQVQLDEQSRKYVVIYTHIGLIQYNRLPYGIASATGIFQWVMESLLRDIPGVLVYIDI